jgi:hypothetical protein
MKTWSQFYDYLMPLVPNCPQPMADQQLRLAAQEWCDGTLCWRLWLDDVAMNGTDTNYDFETTSQQEVSQLLRATLDGKDLPAITADQLPSNWRTLSSFCDRGIFTIDAESFDVVPLQAAGLIVQTEVALRPSNTATGVEDFIFRSYVNEIATGAAGRLHAMPRKPYSYPQSTARGQFLNAIDKVASEISHAFSRAPTRVRAHYL